MKTICKTRPRPRSRRRKEADRRGRGNPPPHVGGYGAERGVALVITLLMLVVITTLAVAFLVLSQRETASVSAVHSTTDAENAADAGIERARAEILAPFLKKDAAGVMVGANEIMGPDFTVSTNWYGQGSENVNPPVIVNTNPPGVLPPGPVSLDNRFFLDLNRNKAFERTGFVDVNGDPALPGPGVEWRVGDPMWIPIFQHPKKPHARDNHAIARYCYLIQPIGRSLDLNWIHNEAVNRPIPNDNGYFRHRGVGPWELNLAAFLADLNANVWNTNFGPVSLLPYRYSTNWTVQPSTGDAFQDARWLLTNRLAGNKYNALSVSNLFDLVGEREFGSSGVDSFSNGPLLPWGYENYSSAANQFDNYPLAPGYDKLKPWPGANSPRPYFTPYELFDAAKFLSPGGGQADFRDRLRYASTQANSHDRYTYYRMLSQLGTDSAPEKDDRIDLNYINVAGVPASALISWTNLAPTLATELIRANVRFTNGFTARYGDHGPENFVNLSVERFLQEDGYPYTTNVNLPPGQPFHIPVYTNGSAFYTNVSQILPLPLYSPRIHQLVQMAANIFESTTAQKDAGKDREPPYYPTVFRPVFEPVGNDIFISRYVLADRVTMNNLIFGNTSFKWYDLNNPTNRPGNSEWSTAAFYDVPWIFGTRKGIPNFNEFNVQSHLFVKRYLHFEKDGGGNVNTNDFKYAYILGVDNFHFAEFANLYTNLYPRPLTAIMINQMTVTVTNDRGFQWVAEVFTNNFRGDYAALTWSNAYRLSTNLSVAGVASVPLSIVVPPNILKPTRPFLTYDTTKAMAPKAWGLTVDNRVRCFLFDNDRLVDAFSSARMKMTMDVNNLLDYQETDSRLKMWSTNSVPDWGGVSQGVKNQLDISTGAMPLNNLEVWKKYVGFDAGAFDSRATAISNFVEFLKGNTGEQAKDAPFSPTRKLVQSGSWQANDPAVHYTLLDLYDTYNSSKANIESKRMLSGDPVDPKEIARGLPTGFHPTLGERNVNYEPWGVGAGASGFVFAERDPMIVMPDSWEFPSHFAPAKYPNVGWLGRVHRGTPWQTVYFKAEDALYSSGLLKPYPNNSWITHTKAAFMPQTFPTNDWRLLDIFTVAVHPNVTRGKLSLNQTNAAAWSAVLSGIGVTSVSEETGLGFEPVETTIQPISVESPTNTANNGLSAVQQIVESMNVLRDSLTNTATAVERRRFLPQFTKLSDLLGMDFLTIRSPYLNPPFISGDAAANKNTLNFLLTDADYERIPQQIAGLVKVGEPRYVIYAWGQSLKPAGNVVGYRNSAGSSFGINASTKIPENYQVTGEMATRAVVKIEYERDASGKPNKFRPRAVVESFNILPTD